MVVLFTELTLQSLCRHWTKVKLLMRDELTADVRRLVFQLPTEDSRLWLPWGKHINLAIQPNELDMIVRHALLQH
jgi:Oxidoreductase FAD-binding domain